MALTVSMTTDTNSGIAIATISGDVGNDDLVVDIAATLSDIAADDRLIVDLTDADHITDHHVDRLISNTPPNVVIVHTHAPANPDTAHRVAASLADAHEVGSSSTELHGVEPQ